jgi:hypothetical protein
MILALAAVHIFFLIYVFTRISILEAVVCVVLPPYALWLYYRDWSQLRWFFFVELILIAAIYFLSS